MALPRYRMDVGDGLGGGRWRLPAQGSTRALEVVPAREVEASLSAATRPASGSERVRSRWPGPVAMLRLTAGFGAVAPAPLGIGSVGRGGSVGDWETRYRCSAWWRRTGGSAVLRRLPSSARRHRGSCRGPRRSSTDRPGRRSLRIASPAGQAPVGKTASSWPARIQLRFASRRGRVSKGPIGL